MVIKGFEKHQLNKLCGVYKITNLINYKIYVGSSSDLKDRYRKHVEDLNKQIHCNQHLQKSVNKHSIENFEFSILEFIDISDLVDKIDIRKRILSIEQKYLDLLNPDYNIIRLAGSSLGHKFPKEFGEKISARNKGRKMSEEDKSKISKTLNEMYSIPEIGDPLRANMRLKSTGRVKSLETRQKLSKSLKGRKLSEETKQKISKRMQNVTEETRQKISIANKGKFISEETRLKQSASQLGRTHSDETKKKMSNWQKKPVEMIDKETGNILMMFESIKDASEKMKVQSSMITQCCNGKVYKSKNRFKRATTAGGYKWRYVNNIDDGDSKIERAEKYKQQIKNNMKEDDKTS